LEGPLVFLRLAVDSLLSLSRITVDAGCPEPRWEVDIGRNDGDAIVNGFYDAGPVPGARGIRWTGEAAECRFCIGPALGDYRVRLRVLVGFRPPSAPDMNLSLTVNDHRLEKGVLLPMKGLAMDYEAEVPADVLRPGNNRLQIATTGWVPADHGVGTDRRRLGVAVDRIVVEPLR
jgi:hypothetical protein